MAPAAFCAGWGHKGGWIKVGIREREVKEAFQKWPVSVKCLYPCALGGVSGRKLSKPNPYSIIFIRHQLSRNGRKRRHVPAHSGDYKGEKDGCPLGGSILTHSGFFVHCIYWMLPTCPTLWEGPGRTGWIGYGSDHKKLSPRGHRCYNRALLYRIQREEEKNTITFWIKQEAMITYW